MRRYLVIFLLIFPCVAAFSGCKSSSLRRVDRYDMQLRKLEMQLKEARKLGLDPADIKIPEDFRRKIRKLKVHRPYGAVALAVFPGIIVPGTGSFCAGNTQKGTEHLSRAMSGVLYAVAGAGLFAYLTSDYYWEDEEDEDYTDYEDFEEDDDGYGPNIFEWFAGICLSVGWMGYGSAEYACSWWGDITDTYKANQHLAHRVKKLRQRFRIFRRAYVEYCHEYYFNRNKESEPKQDK